MSVQLFAQGDQLTVSATDHVLSTTTATGVYVLQVSRVNMITGTLELRIKAATRALGAGATVNTVRYATYVGVPDDSNAANLTVVETDPFSAPFGCDAVITSDVALVVPWVLKRVG